MKVQYSGADQARAGTKGVARYTDQPGVIEVKPEGAASWQREVAENWQLDPEELGPSHKLQPGWNK